MSCIECDHFCSETGKCYVDGFPAVTPRDVEEECDQFVLCKELEDMIEDMMAEPPADIDPVLSHVFSVINARRDELIREINQSTDEQERLTKKCRFQELGILLDALGYTEEPF